MIVYKSRRFVVGRYQYGGLELYARLGHFSLGMQQKPCLLQLKGGTERFTESSQESRYTLDCT